MAAELVNSAAQLRAAAALERALLWLSVTCSAFYFISKSWQPFPGSVALKGLCLAPLALIAWRSLNRPENLLLGGALAWSCLGDVLLDLPGRFVPGLAAFLVAHLFYSALFARHWPHPLTLRGRQLVLAVAVLLFSLALTGWLWPGLGKLTVPVLFYVGAITLMVESAILAQFRQNWIVMGAVLFLFSDALIGVSKFKMAVPLRDYLVWATYYLGQCGIALGFLQSRSKAETK